MNFDGFVKDIEDNNWEVHGVEVYKNGILLHSYKDTTENIYDIYSATKSILSVATGMVYDKGLIDFNEPILKYLPDSKVKNLNQKQKDIFAKINIQRLLTMGVVGLPFRPEGDNYLDFILNIDIKEPESEGFDYSNIPVYLVCVALENILGTDLGQFIEEQIFKPLEINKYEYGRSPEGIFYGASKIKLTVNELSRIGMLMMNKGVYDGKRLISEKYVELATSVQRMNREGGYGYYFWKYREGFSINGKWCQKCYCLPGQKLMITYLANVQDGSHDLKYSMERNLLGIDL